MADLLSIHTISLILSKFGDLSGLRPNLQKCEVFTSGISQNKKLLISDILGMPLGSLPIKYLGLPLTSRKLSATDCIPLLDKLKARINSWSASMLSYGGRLQLIKSVLVAIVRYWTASFFLPRKTLRDIERLLRSFLWGGPRKAKVKWSDLCVPKEAGGLDLPNLTQINNAYLMKLVCHIYENKETLWFK